MIFLVGLAVALFVVPDAWTIPVIVGAAVLEVVETYASLKLSRRLGPARVGPERLIGQTGRVVEACEPMGRVRIRGEIWQARCPEGAPLDALVRVRARDQLILTVERVDQAPTPG